jgi:hypothetical protein
MGTASDPDRRKHVEREYARITAKAWHDEAFKKRLISDPASVLKEHGIDVAPGRKINVVENSDKEFTLVLKQRPSELSKEQLDKVVGGQGSCVATECDICATK